MSGYLRRIVARSSGQPSEAVLPTPSRRWPTAPADPFTTSDPGPTATAATGPVPPGPRASSAARHEPDLPPDGFAPRPARPSHREKLAPVGPVPRVTARQHRMPEANEARPAARLEPSERAPGPPAGHRVHQRTPAVTANARATREAAVGPPADAPKPVSPADAPKPVSPAGAPKPVSPAGAPKPVSPAGAPKPVSPAGAVPVQPATAFQLERPDPADPPLMALPSSLPASPSEPQPPAAPPPVAPPPAAPLTPPMRTAGSLGRPPAAAAARAVDPPTQIVIGPVTVIVDAPPAAAPRPRPRRPRVTAAARPAETGGGLAHRFGIGQL